MFFNSINNFNVSCTLIPYVYIFNIYILVLRFNIYFSIIQQLASSVTLGFSCCLIASISSNLTINLHLSSYRCCSLMKKQLAFAKQMSFLLTFTPFISSFSARRSIAVCCFYFQLNKRVYIALETTPVLFMPFYDTYKSVIFIQLE